MKLIQTVIPAQAGIQYKLKKISHCHPELVEGLFHDQNRRLLPSDEGRWLGKRPRRRV